MYLHRIPFKGTVSVIPSDSISEALNLRVRNMLYLGVIQVSDNRTFENSFLQFL